MSRSRIFAALLTGTAKVKAAWLTEIVHPPQNEEETTSLIEEFWPTVEKANDTSYRAESKVSKDNIIFTSKDKPMLRAEKEFIQRESTLTEFGWSWTPCMNEVIIVWRFINRYAIKASSIDTENIQVVYSTNHDDWGYEPSRLSVMGPFCGRVFITTYGETWQKARALLRPTFSKSSISDLSSYKVAVEQFLRNIPNDGRTTVDLQPLLANLASYLETFLRFLMGISPNTSDEDERKKATDFIKAFNASMIGMGFSFMIGPFKFLVPKSLTTVAHKQVYNYIDVFVNKALGKTREETTMRTNPHLPMQKSLLEGLAKQTDDRIEIRQNIIQGMMAAQGTTYVLISNTLFLLSRNPELYQRLRDEVEYLDLEASSQLFGSLRDHVFLQNIPRECGANGKAPIFAPKGTTIYTNQYTLDRDETVFGTGVEIFNPGRWNSFNCKSTSWEYMPFGGGPRACVGQQNALVEAAYTVAKITQVYKGLESRDDKDWEGEWKLTAKNVNGCKVACIPA
ncbi:cytochrome P450 [Botrytis cinerea]